MASGPAWPQYAYTIWSAFGPIHFYYGHRSNWPAQPWLDTSGRQ